MTLDLPRPVDFAIITIKEEEFDAVLRRFPPTDAVSGLWEYNLCATESRRGVPYTVATVRCLKQATNEAQSVTGYIIEDLNPRWILLVGIAGAIPAAEYTLGDVVVSTRIYDLNVGAHVPGQEHHYAITADSIHEDVAPVVANLRAHAREFEGWNSEESLQRPRPPLDVAGIDARINGDDRWRQKVRSSILRHFGPDVPVRPPLYTAGPLASSDDLIKDPSVLQSWQTHARDIYAVEMEASGVYRGARRRGHSYPFVSIRGLSDVVGLERDHAWTEYACETAAAFTRVFTDLVAPRIVDGRRAEPRTSDRLVPVPPNPAPRRPRTSSRPRHITPGAEPLLVSAAFEATEILEEYAHRSALPPAEAVPVILRRLNLPWREPLGREEQDLLTETMLTPGVSYPSPGWVQARLPKVPDLLGSVADAIRAAARWPDSYRLNYVRQLSTTNLTRALGAGHTRLAHCLGTLDVATCLLAALTRRHSERLDLEDPATRAWIVATQLYAFLHDRYHGPLGHSLDPLAWLLTRTPGGEGAESALRQLDKAELESQVRNAVRRSNHPIRRLVDFVLDRLPDLYGPIGAVEVTDRLHLLVQLGSRSSVPAAWRFLQDVVDGPIDADRLDYIWRDAHHLGVPQDRMQALQDSLQLPEGGPIGALVDTARIVDDGGEQRLAFAAEQASAVHGLLGLRFLFYVYFYEHPQKRVHDELITRTIRGALDACGCVEDGRVPADISRELRTLTDQDLFHFLLEASALGEAGRPRVLHEAARMTHDVMQARPWTIVWEVALDAGTLAREQAARVARAPLVERIGEAQGGDLVAASRAAQREVAQAGRAGLLSELYAAQGLTPPEGEAFSEAAPVVDFHASFGATFEVLRSAEARLWARLRGEAELAPLLAGYRDRQGLDPAEALPNLILMGFVTAPLPDPGAVRAYGPGGVTAMPAGAGGALDALSDQIVFHAFVAAHPGLLALEPRLRVIIQAWFDDLGYLDLAD